MPIISDSTLIESSMNPKVFLSDTNFTILTMLKNPEIIIKMIMLTKAMKLVLLEGMRY